MDVLPVLCVLGIFCSLALAVDKPIAPEDLDGSGDDEDYSGSGFEGSVIDLESKGAPVYSTSDSTPMPTVEGSTAAQQPEMVDKEETKMEGATVSAETTTNPNNIIEDLFAVDTVAEEATQKATTSPFQQTSTADLEETDIKKHHHHHHHPPHHHHTTTSSTSLPPESDGHDTTAVPPEGVKPHDLPEKTTTSTPDEAKLHPQELTTPAEHLAKPGVLHEETTSSSTTTYIEKEIALEPIDADNIPGLDTSVTPTVAEDSHTHRDHHHPHHHHHHHHHNHPHHPHQTTTSSLDGSDGHQVVMTTMPSDLIEHEDKVQGEPTTPVAEGRHPHHGHPHHTHHHHETTPSTPRPTEPEKPHKEKGRRVHLPDGGSTTAVPVINEDHIPENDFTSATVYNVSRNPFDEEPSDSVEGSSGVQPDEDIYIHTVAPLGEDKMIPVNPPTDDGTSNASHGIMERKELLAGIIAGGVAGLVFAAFLVAFVLYRMKKKDEGSYSLEEPKQSNGGYQKPREQREFYA